MLVFRDGRRSVSGRELRDQLAEALRAAATGGRGAVVTALLRAGELECALADAGSPSATTLAHITDDLALALLRGGAPAGACALLERADRLEVPSILSVSTAEGFAYYALHPLDFAVLAESLAISGASAAVIGIRGIGTTLSAVVCAALSRRGVAAERTTVRPAGHPFDRQTELTPEQRAWVQRHHRRESDFLVVDEGPGLSGSSFLSVGEALIAAGVARERVTFLASCAPDIAALRAPRAAERWRSFRVRTARTGSRFPADAAMEFSGGEWRRHLLLNGQAWPASWTAFERRKFLSRDGESLYKFEGLGRFGEAAHARARALADLRVSPPVSAAGEGYLRYDFLRGAPMSAAHLSPGLLRRMARYCAARVVATPAAAGNAALADSVRRLEHMVASNLGKEFGEQAAAEMGLGPLVVERAVIADARMQPWEWIATPDGSVWKTDAAGHGDDHFFPGPTDIAWDLAGAIVEWELDEGARACFLSAYRRASGDDAALRLSAYILAYSVFRMGYCRMAAAALGGAERIRLERAGAHYRRRLQVPMPVSRAGRAS